MNVDLEILLFIQEHIRCAVLTPFMRFFSLIGEVGAIWVIIGLILCLYPRTRMGGFYMLLSLVLGFMLNNIIIKNVFQRPRPYVTHPEIISLMGEVSEWSFPSGHTCSSFACATALAISFGKKGALAYILAVLIAFSRLYIGVHYPSDILGGMIVGAMSAFGVSAAGKNLVGRRIR